MVWLMPLRFQLLWPIDLRLRCQKSKKKNAHCLNALKRRYLVRKRKSLISEKIITTVIVIATVIVTVIATVKTIMVAIIKREAVRKTKVVITTRAIKSQLQRKSRNSAIESLKRKSRLRTKHKTQQLSLSQLKSSHRQILRIRHLRIKQWQIQ